MRKCILSLFALLTCSFAMSVHATNSGEEGSLLPRKGSANVMSQPGAARIELADDEKVMAYTKRKADDYGEGDGSVRFPSDKDLKAALRFDTNVIGKFIGGEITKVRFALWESVGGSVLRVYEVAPGSDDFNEIYSQNIASTAAGWNEITLDKPVTIKKGTEYVISYDYKQEKGKAIIVTDLDVSFKKEGDRTYIYGDPYDDGNVDWQTISESKYGNLMMQAVVKGGSWTDDDIVLSNLKIDKLFYKPGEEVKYGFRFKTLGLKELKSYKLKTFLGDVEMKDTMDLPRNPSESEDYIACSFTVPENISADIYPVTVKVTEINGKAPTENTYDDELTNNINVYSKSLKRQKNLIERFASQLDEFTRWTDVTIDTLQKRRNDLALAFIHNVSEEDKDKEDKDIYVIDGNDDLASYLTGGQYNVSFNRSLLKDSESGRIGVGLDYANPSSGANNAEKYIKECNDNTPTFTTINIEPSYNSDTKELVIKVSGEAEDVFNKFMGEDAAITVYLTEDSLISRQMEFTELDWVDEYVHNHVVRAFVTDKFGDGINWNGSKYENVFTTKIDDSWKIDNMEIVAFIGHRIVFDGEKFTTPSNSAWVDNAETAKISKTTAVDGVVSDTNAKVIARYTIDGYRIDAPVKGINILKMSDGRTLKVMVRK